MKVGVLATMITILLAVGLPFAAVAGPALDMDSDGTFDILDFCKLDPSAPVPKGCDTDMDGYGNACDSDFNNDGVVGLPDFGALGMVFSSAGPPGSIEEDADCDGIVGLPDFGAFGMHFSGPPGPSGMPCAGTVTCP